MARNKTRKAPTKRLSTAILAVVGSVIVSFTSADIVHAVEGALDDGFGTNGKVTTHIGGLNQWNQGLNDVEVTPDGKILVAGYHKYKAGQQFTTDFAVARYLSNGVPDPEFGAFGVNVAGFGSGMGAVAMAVQADGKAVLVGAVNEGFGVMRFNTEGGLDRTFSGDGKVTTDVGTGSDQPLAVAVQADGKILVAGKTQVGAQAANRYPRYDFAVVRYLPNGSLDTNFGTAGKVTTKIGGGTTPLGTDAVPAATVFALAVQPDGKIIAAGEAINTMSNGAGNGDFALARYTPNGDLDTEFGVNGTLTTDFVGSAPVSSDTATSVALQSDGKILVAGTANNSQVFALARYNTNGSLDRSFGSFGKVTLNLTAGLDVAFGLGVQRDGRIVLAGTADYSAGLRSSDDFGIARFTSDGEIDTTFSRGLVRTAIGSGADVAKGMAIQTDGDIVVAGSSYNGKDNDFALTRFSGDETSPSISITRSGTGSLGAGATDALTFTLSEPSTTFDQSDVSVGNGTLSAFTGSGSIYTASLTSSSATSATITVDVEAGRFTDLAGNPNIAANQVVIAFDPTLPSTAGAGTVPPPNNATPLGDTTTAGNPRENTRQGDSASSPAPKSRSTADPRPRSTDAKDTGSSNRTSSAAPILRVRKTLTLRAVATSVGLRAPKTSKVSATIAKTTAQNCSTTASRVRGLKLGSCRIKITVTQKDGSTSQKSVTLRVTK